MKNDEKPDPHQKEEDAASAESTSSYYRPPAFSQLRYLFWLVLKLKIWWFLLLPLPATLLLSNMYLPALFKQSNPSDKRNLRLYSATDFTAEENRVLVDRKSFPLEVANLEKITKDRGGNTGWLLECTPESKCRTQFISESQRADAYIRFAKRSENNRAISECFLVKDSSLRCAYIFHLMVQAMSSAIGRASSEFIDVQFFKLKDTNDFRNDEITAQVELKKSKCADWLNKGLHVFDHNHKTYTELSLSLSTIGVSLYFLIATAFRFRALKTNGFLNQLVRNGMSVTSYWVVVWLITFGECLLFSGLFVMSYVLYCPGVYPAVNVLYVFLIHNLHCLLQAGIVYLIELLILSHLAALLVVLLVSFGQIISFVHFSVMQSTGSFITFLFPPMHTKSYIVTHLTANIRYKLTGTDPVSSESSFHLSVILSISGTVLFFIVLVTYLDSLLRTGNGLNLPWYYPLTCRFWLPDKAKDDDRVHLASKVVSDPAIEHVTGSSVSVIADRISKSYNAFGCCCPGVEVLHRISCLVLRDQVTALVGHGFAGKTTLLKILTGDEEPSNGTAYVAGFRVTDPLERLAARGIFSVCPQIDPLCGSLTSMECIEAVLVSKGANFPSELNRARVMLEQLEVRGIETAKTRELSVSQRRKLSTVLALVADPDVVFLDDPTNGLDPISALQLWGLLQEEKHGRSIVVCTQSMHEADLLADRKAIICDGDIVCAGSSQFLQRICGCSTTLTVSLKHEIDADQLLQKLSKAQLKKRTSTELQLEMENSFSALDEAVRMLEESKDIVASFTVSQTTITDVFKKLDGMRMSDFSRHLRSGRLSEYLEGVYSEMANARPDLSQAQANKVCVSPSVCRRFVALFIINLKRQLRSGWQIVGRIVLPLLFLSGLGLWIPMYMRMYNSSKKIDSVQSMKETDSYSGFFHVRSEIYSDVMDLRAVCIRESDVVEGYSEEFCSKLMFSNTSLTKHRVIIKPKSETLKTFLRQPSTIRQLREGCKGIKDVMPPCIVYYSNSWNPSLSNIQRSITVGVFVDARATEPVAHVLRRGFLQLLRFFDSEDERNTTAIALSHIRPFSQYGIMNLELILLFAFFNLFPISFIRDIVEDASSNVRYQLSAMGMGHSSYWVNTFLVHWIQYAFCFLISASLMIIWDRNRDLFCLLTVGLPLLICGTVSNQLAVYTIASVSKSSKSLTTVCYQVFTLIVPTVLISLRVEGVPLVAPLIFSLPSVASFSVAYFGMLQAMHSLEYYHKESIAELPDIYNNLWNNNIMYIFAVAAVLTHLLIFCWILHLVEHWNIVHGKCTRSGNYNEFEVQGPRNPNVTNEENRVLKYWRNPQNVLEIAKVRKTFPNGVEAVRGVTFGAMAGEILGLLGSSGAGKSALLSVIAGKEKPTEGSICVRLRNANWQKTKISCPAGAIGFCPQHCPLYDCITMAEHLTFYARIRGVPSALATRQSVSLMGSLGLLSRQHNRAWQLSIGEKRRLCLIVALLGDPALVVIDEAAAGVDPKARGIIRGAIVGLRHQSRAVLLATRRIEQADALCDRVGVISRGRMIAFNTVQKLNDLFDEAFTLELTMENVDPNKLQQNKLNLKGSLATFFEGISVLNDWGRIVQICVPKSVAGGMFNIIGWLANNTRLLGVQRYTMHEMSFDESLVFLAGRFDPRRPLMKPKQQVAT